MIIPRRKPYFPPKIIQKLLRLLLTSDKEGEVERLEKDLERNLGIKNPIAVSSGRMGLYLILKAADIKKGAEIIVPGYTFGTLTKFIKMAGFRPVPIDIDPETFQMATPKVRQAITKKTAVILATHIFGEPCEIVSIKSIARKHKLLLIEDCAESLGATVQGKLTGHFGDVAISSFNIAKPLHGLTGGLIYGRNKKLITKVRELMREMPDGVDATRKEVARGLIGYFLSQTFVWPLLMYIFSFDFLRNKFVAGYRSKENKKVASVKLPAYIARLIRLNLTRFKKRVDQRLHIKNLYQKHLSGVITFQKSTKNSKGNGYMIVGTINAKPLLLRRHLAARGIDIAIKEEIADDLIDNPKSIVSRVHKKAIALPVYESLTNKEIKFVSKNIKIYLSRLRADSGFK